MILFLQNPFGPAGRSLRAAMCATTLLSAPALAAEAPSARPAAVPAPTVGPARYSVRIEGAPGRRVENLMRESSQLVRLRDNPPMTLAALGQRIAGDERRFRAVLESEGYYIGTVVTATRQEQDRVAVTITVTPGERYRVGALAFDFTGASADTIALIDAVDYETALQDVVEEPARAADVILAEDTALDVLRANGFPFAARGERKLSINHEARTVAVVLPVTLGHQAVFGATRFSGLDSVNESHVQRLVPWPPGETFDLGALDQFRNDLVTASLFSSVRIEPAADSVPTNGAPLDVAVDLTEAPHRSVGAGLTYARDKGLGASTFWTHRNLFGNGERFEAKLDGTELDQTAGLSLDKPAFLSRRNTLKLGASGHHAETEAFTEWSGALRAGLEHRLTDLWRVSGGGTFEYAALTEDDILRHSYLTGLPLGVSRGVDERLMLELTRGWRLQANVTPYVGAFAGTVTFVHLETEVSGYLPLDAEARYVLAGRVKVGSLLGEATDSIPANKRFYAGGGGSIRGFGYQLVGPLDAENSPVGGRGLVETSFEARLRITDTIGIVPFVDAGIVSRHGLPGQDGDIRVGAGLGIRYYTAAGPLRVDFATPLNRRPGVDNAFQFYISFGQAF